MATPSPGSDPPPALRTQFWLLVGVINLALLTLALGVLVLMLWSRPAVGWGLLGFGAAASGYAWVRYRRVSADLGRIE